MDANDMPVKMAESSGPAQTRMSYIDKGFWLCEQPGLVGIIGNIWELEGVLDLASTVEFIKPFFSGPEYRRYRQIGRESWGTVFWTDYPDFDFNDHILERVLPAPGTREQLQEVVSEIFSVPLDRTKPLWDLTLIQGAEQGGTIMAFRQQHAVSDGQGSIRALLSVLHPAEGYDFSLQYIKPAAKPTKTMPLSIGGKVLAFLELVVLYFVKSIVFIYKSLAWIIMMLVMICRPKVALNRPFNEMKLKKQCGWSEGMSLERVKFIKNAFKVTVNDVVVACATGALRSYFEDNNLPNAPPVCGIPVSLRRPNDWTLNNKTTLAYTYLPTTEGDRQARLQQVRRRMDNIKSSPGHYLSDLSTRLFFSVPFIGHVVRAFNYYFTNFFISRVAVVLTNVPGPQVPLVFNGAKIVSYSPFMFTHCAGAINFAVLSYSGKVYLGVQAEEGYVPGGADDIVRRFEVELDEFYAMAEKMVSLEEKKEE